MAGLVIPWQTLVLIGMNVTYVFTFEIFTHVNDIIFEMSISNVNNWLFLSLVNAANNMHNNNGQINTNVMAYNKPVSILMV